MKSTTVLTTIFTTLLSTSVTLARPICSGPCIQPAAIYSIKSFTTRIPGGQTIGSVFFKITSANGGILDFTCSAYDSESGHVTTTFESGKMYPCAENPLFSFAYTPNAIETHDDLVLWQQVSDTETWVGSTTPADGICTNGGNHANDLVCISPDQEDSYVEMRRS